MFKAKSQAAGGCHRPSLKSANTCCFGNLPENKREEILDFARFLYQKA
jgi:hypothetical protein